MHFVQIVSRGVKVLRFSYIILLLFSFFLVSSTLGFTPQSFAPKVNYPVGSGPLSVFASDLDRDGDLDLVTANVFGNNVSVLMNNGNGTFAAKVDYPAKVGTFEVFAADLDGDTFPDLAVANAGFSPGTGDTISVFINSGNGTFPSRVDYITGTGPFSIVAEDLDGDTDRDLAVLNRRGSSSLSILTNDGNGNFCCKVDYLTENLPHKIFISDLDKDGDKDVVVTNLGNFAACDPIGNTVSVFKNNGDGTFADTVNYITGAGPVFVFAANLDGDTFPDLAVTNWGCNSSDSTVSILINEGDGTFAAKVDYITGTGPEGVWAADLDGDGHLDLAVNNFGNFNGTTLSVLKNNGDGTFAAKIDYSTGTAPHSLTSADLDGDGDQDLAVGNRNSNSVSILINLFINQPPVLDPLTPETLYENSSLSFRVHFTDPDIYQASLSSPTILNNDSLIDSGNTAGSYSFKPDTSQAGNYNITFIASDGILADTDSVAITVLPCTNKPGDVDGNNSWTLVDIVGLVGIVFKGAPKPTPLCRADCNGTGGNPSLTDIVYLVSKVFKGGPNPVKIGACCL